MSQVADFDILKEIPGYKAILKSVLKTQIQLLIEQLSDQTGEESIILTASINEGTLSHLGSNMGKGFFEGRDEIKSQFLGYCLKNYQKKDGSQAKTAYQEDTPPDGFQQGPPKRQKVHPVSVTRVEEDYGNSSFIPDPGSQDSFTPSLDRNKAFNSRASSQPSAQNMKRPSSSSAHGSPVIPSTQFGGNGVKIETNSDNQDSDQTVDSPHEPISVQPFEPAVLPSSVHLSHTQTQQSYTAITENDAEPQDDSNLSAMGQSGDSSEHSNVKMEPVTENESELEITGVEMAGGATSFQGDWGQDISGGMGYDQSDSRDGSLDQSGNQYRRRQRTSYTHQQTTILEKEFSISPYPTHERKQEICRWLRLNETQVTIWFQNRRMKQKKEQLTKEFTSKQREMLKWMSQ